MDLVKYTYGFEIALIEIVFHKRKVFDRYFLNYIIYRFYVKIIY